MNQKEKKRLLSVGAIPAAGNIDEFIEKRMQAKFPKLYPDDEAKKTMLRKDNAQIDAFMKRYEKDKNLTDEFRKKIRREIEDGYARARGKSKDQSGGMKAGGSVKAKKKAVKKFRGDGIARKGKTKGRMI